MPLSFLLHFHDGFLNNWIKTTLSFLQSKIGHADKNTTSLYPPILSHGDIGVCKSKQIFGMQRIFAQIFPNLPKKLSCSFCRPFLWSDLQKMVFTCFSAIFGRHISKSNIVGRYFCPDFQGFCRDIYGFCSDFQGFCQNFQRFCPNFQGFCPDFQQIKTFGGALAPPPPTPLHCKKHLSNELT